MGKKININCGDAIMLSNKKDFFEGYEKGMINAGDILISSKLHAELNKMNFSINAGDIITIDVEGDVVQLEENSYLNENMSFNNNFIVSTGNLIIEPSFKSLQNITGIYTSGTIYRPESINVSSFCRIYSKDTKTYPDNYKVKLGDINLDEGLASLSKNSYFTGCITVFDEDCLKKLSDKNIKLKGNELFSTEELSEKYSDIIQCEKYTLLKEKHEIIQEDITLDDTTSAIYGDKIFVKGDLKLNKKDSECLKEFTSIIVKGRAKIPFECIKYFKQIGKADEIFLFKGELLDIDGKEIISKEMLESANKLGVKYTINVDGKLIFNEDILPEDLSCIEAIYYNGIIHVYDSLKPFIVKLVKKGDGMIKHPMKNSEVKDEVMKKIFPDDEWIQINTGTFIL